MSNKDKLEAEKKKLTIQLITLFGLKNFLKRKAVPKRLDEIDKQLKEK